MDPTTYYGWGLPVDVSTHGHRIDSLIFITMVISLPSAMIILLLLASLWRGSIRLNTPMLFALGFLPMFGLGGLTGLPLGLAGSDVVLHDTYYVVAHFHYVVAPGILFALLAGVYHWFPKVTGRRLAEGLGRLHFGLTFVLTNGVFLPMFLQGFAGVSRRLYDPTVYAHAQAVQPTNVFISYCAWLLLLAQLPFVVNLLRSVCCGEEAGDNPWNATTLEWATTSPPPPVNFAQVPVVHRGPYEYSVPGMADDFLPQHVPAG